MDNSGNQLALYHTQPNWKKLLVFWLGFAAETLLGRRLARLARLRLGNDGPLDIKGLENLPDNGTFMLGVNHFEGQFTPDNIAVVLTATNSKRPDLQNQYFIVTGERTRTPANGISRLMMSILRLMIDRIYRQWRKHAIRISADSQLASIKSLREWRHRVNQQPGLVFPEGVARLQFGAIRPNAGRWLGTLPIPTVPVGVWWCEGNWHVRFGHPIKWSRRSDLHDLQLGLAMSQLLPVDLAVDWQEDLRRWHIAHQQNI